MSRGFLWRPDQIQTAQRMYLAGAIYPEIARAIGKTEGAVAHWAVSMRAAGQLPPRPSPRARARMAAAQDEAPPPPRGHLLHEAQIAEIYRRAGQRYEDVMILFRPRPLPALPPAAAPTSTAALALTW